MGEGNPQKLESKSLEEGRTNNKFKPHNYGTYIVAGIEPGLHCWVRSALTRAIPAPRIAYWITVVLQNIEKVNCD